MIYKMSKNFIIHVAFWKKMIFLVIVTYIYLGFRRNNEIKSHKKGTISGIEIRKKYEEI